MLLYLLIGILLGVVIAYVLLRIVRQKDTDDLNKNLESKLLEIFPRILQNANQQLITMADQKLGAEKREIKTDLQNKRTAIEDSVKRIMQELEKNNKRIEDSDRERVGSFRELKVEIENNRKLTEQLKASADDLKNVLSNNQFRGQFGEQVAEDLLRMCGFVKGVDYHFNKNLKSGESRPDFTVLLPDGVKINIDVKFPYSNLQKMAETDDKTAKQEYLKLFERDIKDKIKQITTRNYINTEDNTVDFVILFIPNEMIFSYIYEKMNPIWIDAMKQKIIFAGPFNFTAILRLIRQSYVNFRIAKDIHRIIAQIKIFEEEFGKYNMEFEKIGNRIDSLADQFEIVDRTRTKKLLSTIEKITQEELSPTIGISQDTLLTNKSD